MIDDKAARSIQAKTGQAGNSQGVTARDPLERLKLYYASQARLCDWLEEIADGLPTDFSRFICSRAVQGLHHEVPLHHRLQEQILFPLLASKAMPEDELERHLAQLRLEHAVDECFAGEVSEMLCALLDSTSPANPDAAGYMLRGFFETYRRHIAWEHNIIMPLARRRLAPDDLTALDVSLAAFFAAA